MHCRQLNSRALTTQNTTKRWMARDYTVRYIGSLTHLIFILINNDVHKFTHSSLTADKQLYVTHYVHSDTREINMRDLRRVHFNWKNQLDIFICKMAQQQPWAQSNISESHIFQPIVTINNNKNISIYSVRSEKPHKIGLQ